MKDALTKAKLPPLVYMIWDEPRFFDEKKFGILRPVGALTTSDICKQEMYECLKRGGVFTHLSVDNPCEEFGPALLRYARKHGVKDIGFSGIGGPMFNRYEVGLMVASTGVTYYSEWHASFYIAYHPHHKAFVRGQNMVGYGEGMIDLRYHDTLRDAMAEAKRKGVAAREVAAAEKYLAEIFRFCNGDMSFRTELDPGAYNGTAEYWGDDWFYDRWRAEMRRHTLAIRERIGRKRD